ncbi:hypothetical protein ABFT80_24005 [Mesorhizobium sp. SB112]|uniref:hypothetical protein n=1 Tax=Mesorhizobium sp. SB112 TaxID=3151853 RepID=UPI00326743B0
MLDTINSTSKIKELIANAPKPTAKKKKVIASKFEVRQGSMAVCLMMTGDVVSATFFHSVLEIWVETEKKPVRLIDGEMLECMFLTGEQLQTLSGLTKKQIEGNARQKLKDFPFIKIGKGRISPDNPNSYRIHLDQEAFWLEVAAILDPTKQIKTKDQGVEWVKKTVDRSKLPYVFKRLYAGVVKAE